MSGDSAGGRQVVTRLLCSAWLEHGTVPLAFATTEICAGIQELAQEILLISPSFS